MKTVIASFLTALLLSGWALAGSPRPTRPPATPGVTLVNCWERSDGSEGFICVEQRPRSPRAVAFTYLVKTDTGLFGARIPQR
jgi:hypothetical protein